MDDSTPRKSCFELRAALEHLGLQQVDLAKMCGVGKRQVWKWCEGQAETPAYVWALLSAMEGVSKDDLRRGAWFSWRIKPFHVFANRQTMRSYKAMAKRFHPDISGRDTTAEMQIINSLRARWEVT